MRTTIALFLVATTTTGCRETPVEAVIESIRLEARIGRTTLLAGDTTSFVFSVQNVGAHTVRLTFSSTCQVVPYVAASLTEEVVYPHGGNWYCATVVTELVLPPGATRTRSVVLRGGSVAAYPEVSLPPGEYRAFAALAEPRYGVRSNVLSLTVR